MRFRSENKNFRMVWSVDQITLTHFLKNLESLVLWLGSLSCLKIWSCSNCSNETQLHRYKHHLYFVVHISILVSASGEKNIYFYRCFELLWWNIWGGGFIWYLLFYMCFEMFLAKKLIFVLSVHDILPQNEVCRYLGMITGKLQT